MSQGHAEIDTSIWTTEDGRVFKLTEMADSHLHNTVRFLKAKLSSMALADTPKEHELRMRRKHRELILLARLKALEAEVARRLRAMSTSTEVPV